MVGFDSVPFGVESGPVDHDDRHGRPEDAVPDNVAVIGPLGEDSSFPDGAPDYMGPRVGLATALAQKIGRSMYRV